MEIVAEKNVPTYCSVISKYDLLPDATWMIGNSPKSDINPALAAGLNAGFVRTAPRGFWSTRKSIPRSPRGSYWWWRTLQSCGPISRWRRKKFAETHLRENKIPPLRSLRLAPVGMTRLFLGLKS